MELKPDVIAHASASEAKDWHPVVIVLRRDDAGRLAIGLNMLLRAAARAAEVTASEHMDEQTVANAGWGLMRNLASLPAETRRVIAEVAMALDIRLVAVPNAKDAAELRAQASAPGLRRLYDEVADDLNAASVAFGEEPGSIYARCGHKRYAEVGGRIRCGEMACPNYVRKALARWEADHGASQQNPETD